MMTSVVNQPKTPHRTIRVPDDVWAAAKEKAERDGTNLSEKIREWLVDYVAPRKSMEQVLDELHEQQEWENRSS